ncbi:MAG: dCTP deaminase [Patescibacteria group bacterium]|nr:dCTP deaminase [Patescibacteria group bacterium]
MNKFPGVGVFSRFDLETLIDLGRIKPLPGFNKEHIQPASIDLTVSNGEAYQIDRLMRPCVRREKVRDMLHGLGARKIGIGSRLEPGCNYLVKATVDVDFPPGLYGYTNAKSTSGRTFLFSRILVDTIGAYDTVDDRTNALTGEVWLSLQPLVFPIVLSDKECYAQLRVFDGDTRIKSAEEIDRFFHLNPDIVLRSDGSRFTQEELAFSRGRDGSMLCTLFAKAGNLIGFRARNPGRALDLSLRGMDPRPYFEPVYAEPDPCNGGGGSVTVEPGWFYLFSTNEMVHVPEHICFELKMLDPRLDIFFSHFAGFFDPGFLGVPTLEVATIIPTTLRHGQEVACFVPEYMRSKTVPYLGNYQKQAGTKLPKQFKMPDEWEKAMLG